MISFMCMLRTVVLSKLVREVLRTCDSEARHPTWSGFIFKNELLVIPISVPKMFSVWQRKGCWIFLEWIK